MLFRRTPELTLIFIEKYPFHTVVLVLLGVIIRISYMKVHSRSIYPFLCVCQWHREDELISSLVIPILPSISGFAIVFCCTLKFEHSCFEMQTISGQLKFQKLVIRGARNRNIGMIARGVHKEISIFSEKGELVSCDGSSMLIKWTLIIVHMLNNCKSFVGDQKLTLFSRKIFIISAAEVVLFLIFANQVRGVWLISED